MSKMSFVKAMMWVGFISLNTLIFKTWFEVSLIPFIAPGLIGTPAMQLFSSIAGLFWSAFIFFAWWLKFRKGGGDD